MGKYTKQIFVCDFCSLEGEQELSVCETCSKDYCPTCGKAVCLSIVSTNKILLKVLKNVCNEHYDENTIVNELLVKAGAIKPAVNIQFSN